jgi:putative tryptophan/tyrosine transport system substrate-binding protein
MWHTTVGLMVLLTLGVLGTPLAAAQQPTQTMPRIGVLTSGSLASDAARIEAFRHGLRELGYVEGHSIDIEYRYGEGKTEHYPALVTELIQRHVAVLVVGGATATRAATQVTTRLPLVMTNVTDPVALGLVASLARPGGNLTGVSNLAPELAGKQLELLKELVPQLARVAALGDPSSPSHAPQWRETARAAQALGVQVHSVEVREPHPDFAGAFAAITRSRADALLTLAQPLIEVYRQQIVDFTVTQRLPAIFHRRGFVEAGGLMSYGANAADLYRRAATFVDKILKGAQPAELPVEQPVKFDLVINLKTAKALGITIPPVLLFQATEVIQ